MWGSVTDPELVPLSGVAVTLVPGDATRPRVATATDDAGGFLVKGLAAGEYVAYASKVGYLDAQGRAATVAEGETTRISLVLEPLPSRDPFHESVGGVMQFRDIVCVFVLDQVERCATGTGLDNLTKRYTVTESMVADLQGFVMDMMWEPTVSVCGGHMRIMLLGPDFVRDTETWKTTAADPNRWENSMENSTPPVNVHVPRTGTGFNALEAPWRVEQNGGPINLVGNFTIRPWYWGHHTMGTPVDFYCAIEETLEYWLTVFFIEPVPSPTWSIYDEA